MQQSWMIRLQTPTDPLEIGRRGDFQWDSSRTAEGRDSAIYLFSKNDIPIIRNSGEPEITMKFRLSFDPEPQWLDNSTWYDWEGWSCLGATTSQVQDDHCLLSIAR